MKSTKTLVLVDGSSYLYRAYHALPPLTTSKGEPTGAMYGVVNMLHKLLDDYHPDLIAVVFDPKGKTFRDELFEAYKAQRPPMPDDLRAQVEPLFNVIRALGLPLLIEDGFEADDVIATLAHQAEASTFNVVISTGDKDLAQLVDRHICLVNTMNNTTMDRQGVMDKFGVTPEQIIDYLALVGDKSDNIPGVAGVGPKTAVKWLATYGSLDNIIENANNISGKVGQNLRSQLDMLPLNKQLVTVKSDVPLHVTAGDLHRESPDTPQLLELYRHYEFSSLLKALQKADTAGDPSAPAVEYETVLTQAALDTWLKQLKQNGEFSFDTETTDLNYMNAELVGVSFCVEPGKAAYVPVAHDYPGAPEQLGREHVLNALKPLLEDENLGKIGHNLKYDLSVLARYDITIKNIQHDTMLESYVLNSTASRHDMDSLALKYLGHQNIGFEDIAGKGAKQLTFNQIPLETAAPYAAEDADITLKLHRHLWPKFDDTLSRLYRDVELPLIPVLSQMERNGVLIDSDLLAEQSRELADRIKELELQAENMAGEAFNLGSPKQIQAILFDKLKLPVIRKTPKGQPSTAEDVLQELAWDYPLPQVLLEHRALIKLKSTYVDKLPLQVNPRTGRIHTSYHQAVAATGRLSSTDPNLQNIPIRRPEGRRVRQAFIPDIGYTMVSADYSQIELRIMAHLSQDDSLCHAFAEGKDIHRATAAEIFNVAEDQVSAEQRRSAKAINFGLIYGMSSFGLARQLGIERNAAQQYIDRYFDRYPGVKRFMDDTRAKAREKEYVETLFGRRLYVPEIHSRNFQRRQYAERTAINAPMQGTAADIIKLAMIKVAHWINTAGVDAKMIMQVHDELVFEIAESQLEACQNAIAEHMNHAAKLSIPLEVDISHGPNWDEAH